MSFWSELVSVTLIGLLAVMSPGPDFIIVTRNSLLYSKKVGLGTALGITAGIVWWVFASLIGISYLISKTVLLFNVIKLAGALYLFYLGVKSLMAKKSVVESADVTKNSPRPDLTVMKAFKIGLLTNLLNPKAALFFVSFFSVILTPKTPFWLQTMFGLEISLIALIWFSLLSTILSISQVKAVFGRISLWVERLTGAILILLGIKLALAKVE